MRDRLRRTILLPMEESKFPVPENETHKLDAIVQTLSDQPIFAKLGESVRKQPWPFVLGAFAIGLLCSVGCGRR